MCYSLKVQSNGRMYDDSLLISIEHDRNNLCKDGVVSRNFLTKVLFIVNNKGIETEIRETVK